jgi:hypothetical protein
MSEENLVFGWGVNDVDYNVVKHEVVNGKRKQVWICPYYRKWKEILRRCFDLKYQGKQPTYKNCTVCDEWKYLSNFIKWVDSQPNTDWQICEPDKDFLVQGNKHYSPDTVVFVSSKANSFIIDCGKSRGKYMIGVCDSGKAYKNKPYQAQCSNPFGGSAHIGRFQTELEAHKAWQDRKHEYACKLADEQSDERVASRLREMYAPYKDWTKV